MTEPEASAPDSSSQSTEGADSDAGGPLRTGARFLKYDAVRPIGRGSYTFVYEAHDPFLDAAVAIKVIPGLEQAAAAAAKRAQAEGRRLAEVEHPGIARVYDAGLADGGLVYLVMERLAGRTLRAVLDDVGRLSPLEALELAVDVADAVEAGHRGGVLHRDLKPENIFIEPGNHAKVVDFGFARVLGHADQGNQEDRLAGTLLYMAPELLKGLASSPQSDVFSLGTLLYECLHRHPALIGVEQPALELVGRLQIEVLPPLLDLQESSVPAYVARFVQRAILKQPTERYASMAELATAGRAALERLREDGADFERRELSGSKLGEADESVVRPSAPRRIPVPRGPLIPGVPVASLKRPGEVTERALAESSAASAAEQVPERAPLLPSRSSSLRTVTALLGLAALGGIGTLLGFAFFASSAKVEPVPSAAPQAARTARPLAAEVESDRAAPAPSGVGRRPGHADDAVDRVNTARRGPASPLASSAHPSVVAASKTSAPASSSKTTMDERLEWLRSDLDASRAPPAQASSQTTRSAPKPSTQSILE